MENKKLWKKIKKEHTARSRDPEGHVVELVVGSRSYVIAHALKLEDAVWWRNQLASALVELVESHSTYDKKGH